MSAAPATGRLVGAQVTHVEAIPVSLPLRRPIGFASGSIETAENVLVRVHGDAGLVGVAEAQPRPYTYGETQASIVAAVRDWYAPRLVGADAAAPAAARQATAGLPGNPCARAAVELALADLAAQAVGLPLGLLLGGAATSVPVASMLSYGAPEAMADEALELRERHGIATFKVKVGRDVALDVAAVTAVRDALPDAALYVDANRGWTLEQARAAGDALIELGVSAIEEPLPLDDAAGRRELADRWSVPLAGDESCLSLPDVARELTAGRVGQVSIKVARTALHESAEILAHCRALGVPAVVGSQYEGALGAWASVAFASASPVLAAQPAETGNVLDLASDLAPPPVIADGRIAVPDAPGLGVTVDEDALEHHRIDR